MKYKLVPILIFIGVVFVVNNCFSQTRVYAIGAAGGGLPTGNKKGDVLKSMGGYHLNGSVGLLLRKDDFFSIEAGVTQHYQNWKYSDKTFGNRYPKFESTIVNKNFFYSYYISVEASIPIYQHHNYFYSRITYSNNLIGQKTIEKSKDVSIEDNSLKINAKSRYGQSNGFVIPEIGYQQYLSNGNMFSIGLNVNLGNREIMDGDYQIKENDAVISSSTFSSNASFLGVMVRFHKNLFYVPKKEKIPREKKVKEPKEKKDKEPIEVVVPVEPVDTLPPVGDSTVVEGRDLEITHKIKVHSRLVTIKVWDHQMVDGDRISLNLNGKWILENYTLEKNKHVFKVELEEGVNQLVLHALNLGKYHPNTAAIIVEDDKKEHQVILESDLDSSGTLEIKFKPHDKK